MTSNYNLQKNNGYSYQKNTPSVPMSIYRELAGELHTAKEKIDELKQDNQELYQENQTLRKEIRQLVQSVQNLETTLNAWDESNHQNRKKKVTKPEPKYHDYYFPPSPEETLHSHQEEQYPLKPVKPKSNQEVSGWFVAAAIVMIVFTFSGIGFMVAQPLLNNE